MPITSNRGLLHKSFITCTCVIAKTQSVCLVVGIGDLFCETDDHCTSQISNTFCDDSVCECRRGYSAETHTVGYAENLPWVSCFRLYTIRHADVFIITINSETNIYCVFLLLLQTCKKSGSSRIVTDKVLVVLLNSCLCNLRMHTITGG